MNEPKGCPTPGACSCPTAGEARVREIAEYMFGYLAISSPKGPPNSVAIETALRAALAFPASPPGEGVVALRKVKADLYSFRNDFDNLTSHRIEILEDEIGAALSRIAQGGDAELCLQHPTLVTERDMADAKSLAERAGIEMDDWGDFINDLAQTIADGRRSADLHRPHPTPGSELSGAEALREFASGFRFSVIEESFYKDAYLHITRPDKAISFRLANSSQFSAEISDVERRRVAALAASPSPNPNATKPYQLSGRQAEEEIARLKVAILCIAALLQPLSDKGERS